MFLVQSKRGHYAALLYNQFEMHVHARKHGGTMRTSVFEIKCAIEAPIAIYASKTEPGRELHVRRVGEIDSNSYFTVVVVNPINAGYSEVVSAYNVRKYASGEQLWPDPEGGK